jgi:phage terminase large subunit
LRARFQAIYPVVVEHLPYEADELIAIDQQLEELLPLTMELSQPTYGINSVGKILIDRAPDGMRSPNLADAVMIAFQPSSRFTICGTLSAKSRRCTAILRSKFRQVA